MRKGWFLMRKDNSTVLNTPRTVGGHATPLLSQWYIDWRNADAAAYFSQAIVNSTYLRGVDATFTDDLPGAGQEHATLQNQTGLSDAELATPTRPNCRLAC